MRLASIVAMEVGVDRLPDTSYGSPQPQAEEASLYMEDRASYPTPGEVLGQIGRVIVVCLGLGLLARILVALVGVY